MKPAFFLTIPFIVFLASCEIMPRNTISDCRLQCDDTNKKRACMEFCDCIHIEGKTLDSCLDQYNKAAVDSLRHE